MTKSDLKSNVKYILKEYDSMVEIRAIIKKSYVDYAGDYVKGAKSSQFYGKTFIS